LKLPGEQRKGARKRSCKWGEVKEGNGCRSGFQEGYLERSWGKGKERPAEMTWARRKEALGKSGGRGEGGEGKEEGVVVRCGKLTLLLRHVKGKGSQNLMVGRSSSPGRKEGEERSREGGEECLIWGIIYLAPRVNQGRNLQKGGHGAKGGNILIFQLGGRKPWNGKG